MAEQKFDLETLKTWAANRVEKLQAQFEAGNHEDRIQAARVSEAREFLDKINRVK